MQVILLEIKTDKRHIITPPPHTHICTIVNNATQYCLTLQNDKINFIFQHVLLLCFKLKFYVFLENPHKCHEVPINSNIIKVISSLFIIMVACAYYVQLCRNTHPNQVYKCCKHPDYWTTKSFLIKLTFKYIKTSNTITLSFTVQ